MRTHTKPVRECHGCGLNFADHCGVYAAPREMWKRHTTCPGYKDDEMLHRYLSELARHPIDFRKQKRMEVARERNEGPHYQGTLTFANR